MSDNYKKRAANALLGFHKRDLKELSKLSGIDKTSKKVNEKKKKNERPEKLVEKSCRKWMEENGWTVEIYEAKAIKTDWGYRSAGVRVGHADCMGMDNCGRAVVVEFKACGKLSSFWKCGNERQIDFITTRIQAGAFSVVVDSVSLLSSLYGTWRLYIESGDMVRAREFLMDSLPVKPKSRKNKKNEPSFLD